jgi:two-component system phosphate regulon sensor histidine kinase PhoR
MAIFNINVKAHHIRLLVVSIAISLLSLLGLQFYWLSNAMKLQRENFNIIANNAVHEIAKRLESQEAMGAFLRATLMADNIQPGQPAVRLHPSHLDRNLEESFGRPPENQFDKFGYQPLISSQNQEDSTLQAIDKILADNQLLGNKGFMMAFMREIQLTRSKSIEQRVNLEQLDSITQVIFKKYELTNDYLYELVKADNAFFKRVASENKASGTQHVFLAKLFPSDHLTSNHYLVYRFQNQRAFFFSTISAQMVLSLCAILLLGLSFYLLVDLLLRQKRLSELKTDFINNMTHELKTPIATINLASEALIELGGEQENQLFSKYNHIIFEENMRLKRHVERILNIALLERSGFSLRKKELNMHDLLNHVAIQSELMIQKRNGELVLKLFAANRLVEVDEMHMLNLITNLIDNALKYCSKTPFVSIETSSNETHFIFAVQDNGIGMTNAQTKKIFDKFYRVPTGDVHDVKGFGLGLSYVLSIVELHKGSIEVQSELQKGSTFIIKLPYEKTNP